MDSSNTQTTTRNPQEEVGGGLQPDSPELQPLEKNDNSNLNPNQLPETNNLQVAEQSGASAGTIQVQSSPGGVGPFSSGTSLWVFSGASLILAIILLTMAKVAKPSKSGSTSSGDKSAVPVKSAVNKDKVIAAKSETSKSKKTKAKSKAKKNTKKRKKR